MIMIIIVIIIIIIIIIVTSINQPPHVMSAQERCAIRSSVAEL